MKYRISEILPDFKSETEVKETFKKNLHHYFNCEGIIPVANGTVAIEIALKALKIPLGKSVIVPDISFIATATAVANCGLIPVYADVDDVSFGITLENIKAVYCRNEIAAVIVVHFAGIVNREIFAIKQFCKSNGIFLIEDCAQAFPCHINGLKVGTIGDVGTFSFQSSKIINSGEGGLIVSRVPDIAMSCEEIANWGCDTHYTHRNLEIPSSNYRLGALQCYFLNLQLLNLEQIIQSKFEIRNSILSILSDLGLTCSYPDALKNVFDCPFFMIIKSDKKLHTLEPRGEYPMRNSRLVTTIIQTLFPANLEKYQHLNNHTAQSSEKIIKSNDFIYLKDLNVDYYELFKAYIYCDDFISV